MTTPQNAAVATEAPNTLVMNGVNGSAQGINGALKFQARVHVLNSGGSIKTEKDQVLVNGADSAMLLVAAATSYKNFRDVSGDPEALVKSYISAASKKSFEALRKDHVAEHQRLFHRVKLDLGKTSN